MPRNKELHFKLRRDYQNNHNQVYYNFKHDTSYICFFNVPINFDLRSSLILISASFSTSAPSQKVTKNFRQTTQNRIGPTRHRAGVLGDLILTGAALRVFKNDLIIGNLLYDRA